MAAGLTHAMESTLPVNQRVEPRWQSRLDRGDRVPGAVLWLTGLSGSGKTTLAVEIHRELIRCGIPVEYLDGDVVRSHFPALGYSRTERDANVRMVGYLASRLERHGVTVITALISPYRDSRAFARSVCSNFVEVYVSTPLEVCEARDVKGLYAKARRGEIRGFTGVDDPYEPPVRPELSINMTNLDLGFAASFVLDHLRATKGRRPASEAPR
jgi:adenylylsulfate kinase